MNLQTLPHEIRQVSVHVEDNEAGLITKGSVYDYQPVDPGHFVSLTMRRPGLAGYASGALHPIFAQTLPEGFNRQFIAERLARYAKVDDLYLLALQGRHGIGMLRYQADFQLPESKPASLSEILTYQAKEPLFPQLLERYYLGRSLAGMQPKVGLAVTDRTVEQHEVILKSFDPEFPLLTVNEFVCMEAARHCGLNPPKVYLSDDLATFVVERFDQPAQCPLGFEDFTVLMRRPSSPDAKYIGSYESLLSATYQYTNSLIEVERMYGYLVFNCLIGNGDAHLKNFALQYQPDMKNIFVAPPFDITHTLIYDSIDDQMALKMDGDKSFPRRSALVDLAQGKGFRVADPDRVIDRMATGILEYVERSSEIDLLPGLKQSIKQSVAAGATRQATAKPFRHSKKRKFE